MIWIHYDTGKILAEGDEIAFEGKMLDYKEQQSL
jgi:hypothetical protein